MLIQLRRGLAATWTSANPTLASGEVGVETDTLKVKVGNGSTAWNSLGYLGPSTGGVGSVAGDTHAATSKATPVDADEVPLVDSAAAFALKRLTWANLKATLKTYFDSLPTTYANKTISGATNTLTNIGISSLSATGTPSTTTFLRGDNAWTAPTAGTLSTPRTIDGVSFDGSANITVIAPGTHAATSKTTPVAADEFPLADSAASFALKRVTLTNLATATVTSTTVAAAGAVMNTDLSTTAMQFVLDEDNMSSNSATKVPTQQSVKAYIDAAIATVGGGGGVSASRAMAYAMVLGRR
jgi:Major tropism determinant N-terminal domain